MKQKTCKECKKKFTPTRQLQPTCPEMKCMQNYAFKHLSKKDKWKTPETRKGIKAFNDQDGTTLKIKAQDSFNRYKRLEGRGNSCISCDKPIALFENSRGILMPDADAGHYFSVGKHSAVRFNLNNVWLECKSCNRFSEIHLLGYEKNLIKKIGQARFDKLKEASKKTKRYSAVYYQRIIDIFNKKSKILENLT